MHVDHITYEVPVGSLQNENWTDFFNTIELEEIEPDEPSAAGYHVRWWEDTDGFQIHLVEPGMDSPVDQQHPRLLGLGHFCVFIKFYDSAMSSKYCTRAREGSERIWLTGPCGLRVEVREENRKLLKQPPTGTPEAVTKAFKDTEPIKNQTAVMVQALNIYGERNMKYKDNWRRFGWRGCLFRMRERVERAWDYLWDYDLAAVPDPPNLDDLYDLINFAAFTIRAIEEDNRDGDWFNESK